MSTLKCKMAGVILVLMLLCLPIVSALMELNERDNYYSEEVPKYIIDLDLQPEARWQHFPESYCRLLDSFEGRFRQAYIRGYMKTEERYLEIEALALNYLERPENEEYRRELAGLSEHCKVRLGYVAMYNTMYELGLLSGCTSVVFREKGRATLANNLDYGYDDYFQQILFHGVFMKEGKIVGQTMSLFGFYGFTTVRTQSVALSLNQKRWVESQDSTGRNALFESGLADGTLKLTVRTVRELLLQFGDNYERVVDRLSNWQSLAPAFYNVAHLDTADGCVIQRNFRGAELVTKLDDETCYIQQTNSNREQQPEKRRVEGEAKLKSKSQDELDVVFVVDQVLGSGANFQVFRDRETQQIAFRTLATAYFDQRLQRYIVLRWISRPQRTEI